MKKFETFASTKVQGEPPKWMLTEYFGLFSL